MTSDERFTIHKRSGQQLGAHDVNSFYDNQKTSEAAFLIRLLDASTRITLADPTNNTNVITRQISHPYHGFFYRTGLESAFSDKVKAAFGVDFRINRSGNTVSGFLGKAPTSARLSEECERDILTSMQPIEDAGDGLRSFTGILLNASADQRPVTLIDEPESFLHPPQARRLGRELAEEAQRTKRQTFVATHSTDIIQGALASSNRNIHLVYLNRKGTEKAHFVSSEVVMNSRTAHFCHRPMHSMCCFSNE